VKIPIASPEVIKIATCHASCGLSLIASFSEKIRRGELRSNLFNIRNAIYMNVNVHYRDLVLYASREDYKRQAHVNPQISSLRSKNMRIDSWKFFRKI